MSRYLILAALALTLGGCGLPVAVVTAAAGACAAACAPVVGLEKDIFDYATGQDRAPAVPAPVPSGTSASSAAGSFTLGNLPVTLSAAP